jgi:hypothetical protein
MLMLLCVQVVQTNNNELSWRGKKKFNVNKQKICKLGKKIFKIILKILINKIHELIVKELKLTVNHHIKKRKKSQPSSSLLMHNKT